jgi:hypothetical protein
MKELFSAFQTDVFRPIVTLIIPGALATTTWFIALLWAFPTVKDLTLRNTTEASLILVLVMLAIGLICENIGSLVEDKLDGIANRSTQGRFMLIWNAYLRTAFVADPVGRRYLRTLVIRLKFELGMLAGLFIADLGLIWLGRVGLTLKMFWWLLGGSIPLMFYFAWEAKGTHSRLAQTREEVIKAIRVVKD